MTNERHLLYLHKVLHEDSKHAIDEHKDVQKVQTAAMKQLLAAMEIERNFIELLRGNTADFLAPEPNTCPEPTQIEELRGWGVMALTFPCVRFADNGKSAKGSWLAETPDGIRPLAAEFLPWDGSWKLWHLDLTPTADSIPRLPYERLYPDPIPQPQKPPMGGPGGPAPGGPGGPMPGGPGPDGPAHGGPAGDDQPPFDPDARADVLDLTEDYTRLKRDMVMLTTMALPDYQKQFDEAEALMAQCRTAVDPQYIASRMRTAL